jgi:hypothetical protein
MALYRPVMRLQRRQLEAENKEAASWASGNGVSAGQGASIVEAAREAIREYVRHRDRFAVTYRKALRYAPRAGKRDIEVLTQEVLRLCRAALALRDTLRGLFEGLAAAGRPIGGAERVERAAADFERWLEDVPEEMLLHYRPVTNAVVKAAREALGSPPAASDWRSLFAKVGSSRP